jgi:hypothetical protein
MAKVVVDQSASESRVSEVIRLYERIVDQIADRFRISGEQELQAHAKLTLDDVSVLFSKLNELATACANFPRAGFLAKGVELDALVAAVNLAGSRTDALAGTFLETLDQRPDGDTLFKQIGATGRAIHSIAEVMRLPSYQPAGPRYEMRFAQRLGTPAT